MSVSRVHRKGDPPGLGAWPPPALEDPPTRVGAAILAASLMFGVLLLAALVLLTGAVGW